jgi:hypothetical protein
MNKLNLNIPVSVFSVGVIIFLFAPLEFFYSHTIQEISMAGLLIELVGIIAGLIVLYRHKVTEECLEEL